MPVKTCRNTCDLLVCHNPKAVNPSTGEIVYLARENSTGKLVWMRASEGKNPPPDQIISKASADGGIPEDLFTKLRNAGGVGSTPVLLVSDGVKLPTAAQPAAVKVEPSIKAKKRSAAEAELPGPAETSYEDKPNPLKESSPKSAMLNEDMKPRMGILDPPPIFKSRSKRRKFDINHRKLKKPKRPKTGYNYFQLSIRDKLCDKIPMDDRVLHNETVARIIGKKWKALSKQERKAFQNLAEQDKCRYERELKEYLQKMYELGADSRVPSVPSSDRKTKARSFDAALNSKRGAMPAPLRSLDTFASSLESKNLTPATDLLEGKSKLGQQISNALSFPPSEKPTVKTEKWLDDALSLHLRSESRIRSSLSCENIPLSSSFEAGIFTDKSLNDRKLLNPFQDGGDLYMSDGLRESNFLDNMKAPGFNALPGIESMFFKV
eukprot:393622-Amorphochlora_amoeboformis.AAC.1